MAELLMRGTGNIDQAFAYLDQAVVGHASSCEPAGTYGCAIDDARVILRVYQKYYFRNNSQASLTIMMVARGGVIDAKLISSGGGAGLINVNWGSEKEFTGIAVRTLTQLGFTQVSG